MSTGIVQEAIDHPTHFVSTTTITNPTHPVKFIPEWDPIFNTKFELDDEYKMWGALGLMRDKPKGLPKMYCIKYNTITKEGTNLHENPTGLKVDDFEKVAGTGYHTLKSNIMITITGETYGLLQYRSGTPVALRGGGGYGWETYSSGRRRIFWNTSDFCSRRPSQEPPPTR